MALIKLYNGPFQSNRFANLYPKTNTHPSIIWPTTISKAFTLYWGILALASYEL